MQYPENFIKRVKGVLGDDMSEAFRYALDNGEEIVGRFLHESEGYVSNEEILVASDLSMLKQKALQYKAISDLTNEWYKIWYKR